MALRFTKLKKKRVRNGRVSANRPRTTRSLYSTVTPYLHDYSQTRGGFNKERKGRQPLPWDVLLSLSYV